MKVTNEFYKIILYDLQEALGHATTDYIMNKLLDKKARDYHQGVVEGLGRAVDITFNAREEILKRHEND